MNISMDIWITRTCYSTVLFIPIFINLSRVFNGTIRSKVQRTRSPSESNIYILIYTFRYFIAITYIYCNTLSTSLKDVICLIILNYPSQNFSHFIRRIPISLWNHTNRSSNSLRINSNSIILSSIYQSLLLYVFYSTIQFEILMEFILRNTNFFQLSQNLFFNLMPWQTKFSLCFCTINSITIGKWEIRGQYNFILISSIGNLEF